MPLHFSRPFAHHDHPREIVRQFTPDWFAVTMGTGVVALALGEAPAAVAGLHAAGAVLWAANIVLFLLCTGLYGARWIFFTRDALPIFEHPVMPMFLGAIPMGLSTIVNGFVLFGSAWFGAGAIQIALALWWVETILAVAVCLLVPFLMFTRQHHTIETMTAVWLLPIVTAEVAAAGAGLIAPHLADAVLAAHLVVYGYILWAISVPLALGVLVILFLRLVLHKLPRRQMAVSSWLALGPLGTGALGLLLLGGDARALWPTIGLGDVGVIAHGIGVIGGLILWGYGAWWLAMAAIITASYLREGLPFNMGWWGFTFPLGVYTLATLNLGGQTGLDFIKIIGGVLVVLLVMVWALVGARTLAGAYRGHLFNAPCLATREASSPSGWSVCQPPPCPNRRGNMRGRGEAGS